MSQKKPLLLLFDAHAFDAHALIHRGFHALPSLATKSGLPTGAVYGFATMFLKAVEDFQPSHCAVAFDSAAPTFRHTEFKDYKAHRPKAPDELISQFGLVRKLIQAFNIPAFEVDGFEADDILGTLSKQASEKGIDTIIVTGDTDMLQIVSPGIRVLLPRPKRPFSDMQLYDEEAVRERYHLTPRQLADLKGLKGDPSDNIPGVPGIGEKTAHKLLSEFGNIEEIYRRVDEVTPVKLRENLMTNEEAAIQSKRLATIVSEVPVELKLTDCSIGAPNSQRVIDLFRDLEFSSLINKVPGIQKADATAPSETDNPTTAYRTVDNPEALDELLSELDHAERIAIDTETTSTNPRAARLVGISISTKEGKAWYIPTGHLVLDSQLQLAEISTKLGPVLQDERIAKVAHNGKYDMTVLARAGMPIRNLDSDTMIAAHLLGEKALGLKQLTFAKLGVTMTPITDLIGSGAKQKSMADIAIDRVAEYACADADMTLRLSHLLEPELNENGLWDLFTQVEVPLVPILYRMEKDGIALDASKLGKMSSEIAGEITKIEQAIYDSIGHEFNINSSQQLGKVLFEELGLPPSRKTKNGFSTDMSVLEGLRGIHEIAGLIMDYRQMTKLRSTYIDALPALIDPETGRVHTTFNQTVAATGRLSSSDPNLQNIPIRTELGKRIRQAFVTPSKDFKLLSADYSQIELRIMAHLTQDPGLLEAFSRGEDIHTTTAAYVFGVDKSAVTSDMRRLAKVVNFGVIYGMSDYGLEQATGLTRKEASEFIRTYFEKYPGVVDYVNSTKRQAAERGYVQTILGRKRYIPEINSSNYQARQAAERMAINMPVQGTAADIIKVAMIRIQNELDARGLTSKMLLQVHDELLFEVPDNELDSIKQLVLEVMPHSLELSIPLNVDIRIGQNWGDLE